MKILLIEDDDNLREILEKRLKEEGFVVETADNGEDGLYLGREFQFDLAIIDLGLPRVAGMEIIQTLRNEERAYPILVLTARGSWQDKVMGLDAGADDYLVKPFHFPELLARVNALVRRSAGFSSPELVCGYITLNTSTGEVKSDDRLVDLTSYEYKVLEYLMLHQNEVVSKTTLTEHIYHQDYDRDSNVIEVFVGRLRKKLQSTNSSKKIIETLRGRGYRMRSAADEEE
ncbi:Transcriptional regulatory protein PhoP [hydrothermal vent metagenome]|uniref:Transcriptional regulatory protein PhoP n=1 Tax=hydrothermal vent metagenome TaxID=652676 RepID=A0A3B0VN71_9ZZZZ